MRLAMTTVTGLPAAGMVRAEAVTIRGATRNGGRHRGIAGLVRPARWTARGPSLSSDARTGLREDCGPHALAVAASTGRWGLGAAEDAAGAAIAACAAGKEAEDCAIAVAD